MSAIWGHLQGTQFRLSHYRVAVITKSRAAIVGGKFLLWKRRIWHSSRMHSKIWHIKSCVNKEGPPHIDGLLNGNGIHRLCEVCVKYFNRVTEFVCLCVWVSVLGREGELCWQVASCSWHLDKCDLELLSSYLPTCCLLKGIKMSKIKIHKRWYTDSTSVAD